MVGWGRLCTQRDVGGAEGCKSKMRAMEQWNSSVNGVKDVVSQ